MRLRTERRVEAAAATLGNGLSLRDTKVPSRAAAARIERGWGRWSRTMRLRDGLDAEAISADLADGVLTVTVPVAEAAKPRRIEIGAGGHQELSAAT